MRYWVFNNEINTEDWLVYRLKVKMKVKPIKRNTLMWMGDVTSYIAYTSDATPPSFPANFQQVEWQPSSTGGDSLSIYERQTLSWEFAGEDIT